LGLSGGGDRPKNPPLRRMLEKFDREFGLALFPMAVIGTGEERGYRWVRPRKLSRPGACVGVMVMTVYAPPDGERVRGLDAGEGCPW
jgi:hypothetical protein